MSDNEKTWGMFCHLAALLGSLVAGIGHLLGPLIVWLIKKNEMPFVNDQGKESLNFQISITIYALISAVLIFVGIGIILLFAVMIFDLVMIILASIKAYKGESYRYPLCIRLIK